MTHFRSTIRAELRARAANLLDVTGDALDAGPVNESRLPVAIVSLGAEPVTINGRSGDKRDLEARTLTATFQLIAKHPDQLDDLAAELEVRMVAKLAEGVHHRFTGTRPVDPERGESEIFSIALDYEITYTTASGSPDRLAG